MEKNHKLEDLVKAKLEQRNGGIFYAHTRGVPENNRINWFACGWDGKSKFCNCGNTLMEWRLNEEGNDVEYFGKPNVVNPDDSPKWNWVKIDESSEQKNQETDDQILERLIKDQLFHPEGGKASICAAHWGYYYRDGFYKGWKACMWNGVDSTCECGRYMMRWNLNLDKKGVTIIKIEI